MMFRPRESHDLRLVHTKLDISPRPSGLRWLHDVFDNSVAIATFAGPTLELRFDSTVTLEHLETPLPHYALEVDAQTYPFALLGRRHARSGAGAHSSLPGRRGEPLGRAFRVVRRAQPTRWRCSRPMTSGIKDEFTYVRRSEKGVQRPEDTLRRRSGSCRDFALFMMEAVRSLGLAARFVSGYIFVPAEADRRRRCRRRRDPRVDAGVSAGRRLGRLRSHQQHCGQSQSDSSRRGVGPRAGPALVGDVHRRGVLVSRDGRRGQRRRDNAFSLRTDLKENNMRRNFFRTLWGWMRITGTCTRCVPPAGFPSLSLPVARCWNSIRSNR